MRVVEKFVTLGSYILDADYEWCLKRICKIWWNKSIVPVEKENKI